MSPSAIRFCSSILAAASALPSTRATIRRSSTSSLPALSSFRAKALLSRISKASITSRVSAILPTMENRPFSDVGGTPGGLGHFLVGIIMACLGGYFLANQVSVVGSYWSFYGANTFGITLVPMLFGVGLLFWNGRSLAGWVLTAVGALFILAGVIANMHIYFRPTSLFSTLIMLILLVGGLGLIALSLRPHPRS